MADPRWRVKWRHLISYYVTANEYSVRCRASSALYNMYTRVTSNVDNNSCPLPWKYNILFNIHNYLHFYYFAIHAFCSNFLIAFLSFIFPVEDGS